MRMEASMSTRVVRVTKSTYTVYIGRPSEWGNPFVITDTVSRKEVIDKYEDLLVYDSISGITHKEASWAISQLLEDVRNMGEPVTDVATLVKQKYRYYKDSTNGRLLSDRMLVATKHREELRAYVGVRSSLQRIEADVALNKQDASPNTNRGTT